jgi:microcystin-dependent protein
MAEQLALSAYQNQPAVVAMAPQAITSTGGSQPHNNFQPYLCVDFIISLFGIFPSPTLIGGGVRPSPRARMRLDSCLPTVELLTPKSFGFFLKEIVMADPFVAEIRIFPFNFAPKGWAWCDGQLLPLSQNTALFSLLGTTYGGDGKSNFALPDLQGRAPMHPGQGPGLSLHDLGETGGSETVSLLESEMPAHSHTLQCLEPSGKPTTPVATTIARTVGADALSTAGRVPRWSIWPLRLCLPPEEISRITICSRISPSISISRCRESSRREPRSVESR